MLSQFQINKATQKHRPFILDALHTENLPIEDLPMDVSNFLVAIENNRVVGVVGVEQHEDCGLLRSLVVDKRYRGRKVASVLMQEAEHLAASLGIHCIYLLTETAQEYFAKKGYELINRREVPIIIQATSEFSHICPSSAIVMKKQLQRP